MANLPHTEVSERDSRFRTIGMRSMQGYPLVVCNIGNKIMSAGGKSYYDFHSLNFKIITPKRVVSIIQGWTQKYPE